MKEFHKLVSKEKKKKITLEKIEIFAGARGQGGELEEGAKNELTT